MRNYTRNRIKSDYTHSKRVCSLSMRIFEKSSNIDTINFALSLQPIMFKQVIFVAEVHLNTLCS